MKYGFSLLPLPCVVVYDQDEINVANTGRDLVFAASPREIDSADATAPPEHEHRHPYGQPVDELVDGEEWRNRTPSEKMAQLAFPHKSSRETRTTALGPGRRVTFTIAGPEQTAALDGAAGLTQRF